MLKSFRRIEDLNLVDGVSTDLQSYYHEFHSIRCNYKYVKCITRDHDPNRIDDEYLFDLDIPIQTKDAPTELL